MLVDATAACGAFHQWGRSLAAGRTAARCLATPRWNVLHKCHFETPPPSNPTPPPWTLGLKSGRQAGRQFSRSYSYSTSTRAFTGVWRTRSIGSHTHGSKRNHAPHVHVSTEVYAGTLSVMDGTPHVTADMFSHAEGAYGEGRTGGGRRVAARERRACAMDALQGLDRAHPTWRAASCRGCTTAPRAACRSRPCRESFSRPRVSTSMRALRAVS